jgi:alginate O-acetyltransferase complex protein AlgI
MLFTSGAFFVFLAVTFAVYYLPWRGAWQIRWLVLASLFFYAYDVPALVLLLLSVAAADVFISRKVITSPRAKMWAAAGVVANLTALAFFKYNHLILQTFPALSEVSADPVRFLLMLPLPIGISFYTFHGISLLVDTFRKGSARNDVSSARGALEHSQNTLLYVSFFPQLIAGPIVKAHQFYPQIGRKYLRDIDWDGATTALIVGYFLKVVIADNLSQQTFWLSYPYFLSDSTWDLIGLLFGYSMQIFSDFAGYSLIAIGLAKLFGYNLPTNFFFPYISETFSEFWRRWHISLSSWLRDYLYFPLGGNRRGRLRTYLNLVIVMGLGGMWHGAAWSYGIWGLWHGVALSIERMFSGRRFYESRAVGFQIARGLLVFTVVTAGWLLFKLPNFEHVIAYVQTIFRNTHAQTNLMLGLVIALYSLPAVAYHLNYLAGSNVRGRGGVYILDGRVRHILLGFLLVAIFLNPGPSTAFIYFQF